MDAPDALAIVHARFCLTAAGAHDHPDALPRQPGWHDMAMPGTIAGALTALGLYDPEQPSPLHDRDVWLQFDLPPQAGGLLHFEGLATVAEIWIGGTLAAESLSMFEPVAIAVAASDAATPVFIRFRALEGELARAKGPRARWRTALIPDQRLRLIRTTLLGHMPGWCPPVHAVGPFRPVTFRPLADRATLRVKQLDVSLVDGMGSVTVTVEASPVGRLPEMVTLTCAGRSATLRPTGERRWAARLDLPGIAPWWPNGYGAQGLHDLALLADSAVFYRRRTGFRRLELDRGGDGKDFRLIVNGVPVFARGAVWTPADLVTLASDAATLRPLLEMARDAGFTMLRVGGTMTYEAPVFHDLCDEMGILVFQDLMLANFDYPASDPAFLDRLAREVDTLLDRVAASPSFAVLSGGSEIHQQAAMMGLPPERRASAFHDTLLPQQLKRRRPDAIYVPSSPYGGALPFQTNECITHYYGVGAYERPLEDARRADIRFASECLAFAHIPEPQTLTTHLPVPALHHPRWKERVPRDTGASWDFEDTRDHYLARLYGLDPARLRREDPARYLDLSRAVVVDVMERSIDEWRRPGSKAAGALVWLWRDFLPGAGWGLVDATGRPKSAFYALKHAFAPLRILVLDEGLNGLGIHVVNDGPNPVTATLHLDALRDGAVRVAGGARAITVPAHGAVSLDSAEIIGHFFDITQAYRFGPPTHDLVGLWLERDGTVLAESVYRPDLARLAPRPLGLSVATGADAAGPFLRLSTERAALFVAVRDESGIAEDNYIHLLPGRPRLVRFGAGAPTGGEVVAVNGTDRVGYRFGGAA